METEQPPSESHPAPALPPPRERDIAIWGLILILAGALFLIGNFTTLDEGPIFLLIVGIAFLSAYFLGRKKPGFLIAGSIITGLGVGVLLEDSLAGWQTDGVVPLCLGLGFVFIWVVERRHVWAAITGGILAAIGVYTLANQLAGFQDIARWWPVILIALGLWVMLRRLQPTPGRG